MLIIRRHNRTTVRSRLMLSFTAMALIFSLLGSMDWGSALAQSDQWASVTPDSGLTQDATVVGEETPELVVADDEVPTETPGDQGEPLDPTFETIAVPTIADIVDQPAPGTVFLSKYTCPPGYLPTTNDYQMSEECQENPGSVQFRVFNDASYDVSSWTSGAIPQNVEFNKVPSGDIYIAESIPSGFGTPSAFCSDEPADGAGNYQEVSVDATGAMGWSLNPGSVVSCVFFNFQPGAPADELATDDVWVYKSVCPPGTERTEAWWTLSEECTETAMPVTFVVNTGDYYSSQATVGNPGSTMFSGVPFGTIDIAEDVPFGYGEPLVFCSDTPSDGMGNYEPVPLVGENTATWVHASDSGTNLSCIFFNFHDDSGNEEGRDVHLSKYTCPVGTDRSDHWYALGDTCSEDAAPFEFSVAVPSESYYDTLTATAGVPQEATFVDVPFGTLYLEETVPAGFQHPLVFCSDSSSDGAGNYAVVEPWPESGAFIWEHSADAELDLSCLVFNFHDDDTSGNALLIAKWDCPTGTDPKSGLPDLGTSCARMPGVEFTITDAVSEVPKVTDGLGELQWIAIPAGSWSVQETIPAGYGDPVVFCGPMFETETPRVDSIGGLFSGEFTGSGDTTVCSVFNIPVDSGNMVTVYKYICPPDANPEEVVLLDVCLPGGDGIPFRLVDGLGFHDGTISAGVLEWTGVVTGAEGELQIIETIPVGWSDPVVVCDGLRMDSTNGFVVPDPDGADPFHITCDWFNFTPSDSSLTVFKHECPAGYNLKAEGSQPFDDCLDLVDGVEFHLGGPATDLVSTTGDAGTGMVKFGDLDPGDYILTETLPEGTESSFVADCYGNAIGRVHPYPLATGDTLNITISAGEQVTCYWFNIPDHDDTSLTVQKYTCSTTTFVSNVDCEIFEDGQGFDLVHWNGDAWEYLATATTDGYGLATFGNLEPGEYWLDEHDGNWCQLTSDQLSDDGNWLKVANDEETVVKVYNCDGVPGKSGKIPTKYPDTGVPPTGGSDSR